MNAVIFVALWILLTVLGTLFGVRLFRRVHPVLVGLVALLTSALLLYAMIVAIMRW